jgi:hypothetical protein
MVISSTLGKFTELTGKMKSDSEFESHARKAHSKVSESVLVSRSETVGAKGRENKSQVGRSGRVYKSECGKYYQNGCKHLAAGLWVCYNFRQGGIVMPRIQEVALSNETFERQVVQTLAA